MKVKAKRSFVSTVAGNVQAGQEFECTEGYAAHLAEYGMVEYETKVVEPKPRSRAKKKETDEG